MGSETMGQKFRLDGMSAIVTGAATGIGFAIAEALAQSGAIVHIVDRDGGGAAVATAKLTDVGGMALAYACDVADQEDVRRVLGAILAKHGVDVLVNNAGVSSIGTVATTDSEEMDKVLQINVKSVYYCTRAVIEHMVEKGGGSVLNIASVAATSGLAERFAYSMSKGAVLSMTLSIARDFIKHGIRCNCISPARVHTDFVEGYLQKNYPDQYLQMFETLSAAQPIGRMAGSAEIGDLALYLCSKEARFVTGSNYQIDGGFSTLHG